MIPPVFLVDALPDTEEVVLDGPEGHHAATVRRLRPGEPVRLSDGAGGLADCMVLAADHDRLTLAVLAHRAVEPPRLRFVVVQALAKGERGELAVELMTEFGVAEIVPWQATRAVTRWQGERGERALARWRSTARAAAKQSRQPLLPRVAELHTTGQVCALVEKVLAGSSAGVGKALVLDPEASAALVTMPVPASGDVLLVVGPEGGLTEDELTALRAAGAQSVRLGPSVLRTSTAGAAALAVLAARSGRWD